MVVAAQAVLGSMLPARASAIFCFSVSGESVSDGGSGTEEVLRTDQLQADPPDQGQEQEQGKDLVGADCSKLVASRSLGVVTTATSLPAVIVFAPGIRKRVPAFATKSTTTLTAYAHWLAYSNFGMILTVVTCVNVARSGHHAHTHWLHWLRACTDSRVLCDAVHFCSSVIDFFF